MVHKTVFSFLLPAGNSIVDNNKLQILYCKWKDALRLFITRFFNVFFSGKLPQILWVELKQEIDDLSKEIAAHFVIPTGLCFEKICVVFLVLIYCRPVFSNNTLRSSTSFLN